MGVALLCGLIASCTPLRIQFPLVVTEADWQTDGRSVGRDRVSRDANVQLPLVEAWIYNAGGGFAAGSPLIIDNTVIVGTRKGEVHVVDLVEGDQIGTQEFGRSIEGSPALSGQVLFVPNAWGKKALDAFDLQSGSRMWRHEGVPIEASVLVVGNSVVVGDVEGNVISLARDTGRINWVYEFGGIASILSGPAAVDNDRIVVADETGRIALLRAATGTAIWSRDLGAAVEDGLSTGNGHVYVPTTRGRFLALRSDNGSTVWEYLADNDEVRFTSAAVTSESVVFGGTDGTLRSVASATGALQWTFHTDGTIAGAPAVNGDLVFVGAMDQKIYAVHRASGSVQWESELRGRVKSAPAVRNGYVIVLSEPRFVYAFTNATNIRE